MFSGALSLPIYKDPVIEALLYTHLLSFVHGVASQCWFRSKMMSCPVRDCLLRHAILIIVLCYHYYWIYSACSVQKCADVNVAC